MDLTLAPALGLDPARALDPLPYGAGGRAPRYAVRPVSREEVVEVLRAATRERLGVIPWGGPPARSPGFAIPPYDVALDLSALDRIVEYEPEDLTLTAECGVTVGALAQAVRARGQELALEAAHAGTTLGGAIATNASGARRLRFGAPRDRILGARFVLGDGTLARSGGKVVKNVAGYGIHRMLCGACGALAVIVEASFKLMPGPERRRVLLYHATREQLADRTRWSGFARLEPAVLTVLHGDATRCAPPARGAGGAVVVVGFEDEARWLEVQTERATAALGAPAGVIEGDATLALWQSLADAAELRPSRLSFVTSDNSPSAMAAVLDRLGEDGAVHHALAGRVHLFPASAPVAALANRCAETGFTLVESRGVDVPVPALASPAAVFDLRARVRASLDPGGVLVLGTRWAAGAR